VSELLERLESDIVPPIPQAWTGTELANKLWGDKHYLRFDDITMFTQP